MERALKFACMPCMPCMKDFTKDELKAMRLDELDQLLLRIKAPGAKFRTNDGMQYMNTKCLHNLVKRVERVRFLKRATTLKICSLTILRRKSSEQLQQSLTSLSTPGATFMSDKNREFPTDTVTRFRARVQQALDLDSYTSMPDHDDETLERMSLSTLQRLLRSLTAPNVLFVTPLSTL